MPHSREIPTMYNVFMIYRPICKVLIFIYLETARFKIHARLTFDALAQKIIRPGGLPIALVID
jgi:hypothetical protein